MATTHPASPRTRDVGPAVLAASIGILLLAALVLALGYATGWGGRLQITQSAAPAVTLAPTRASLDLTIVTGSMLGGGSVGPAYVPASFSVPAHAEVTVTVTDFDRATKLTGALVRYHTVTGTVGDRITVQPINLLAPNAATAAARVVHRLPPAQVAHTLTVPGLHLNVPMAGGARTTFRLRTGDPGTYPWECMDPCGSAPGGMGGAMGLPGYMAGTLTVVG